MSKPSNYAFHALVPCDSVTAFRLLPPAEELLADPELSGGTADVLVALDLGHVEPSQAGVIVPFLKLPVCFGWAELERGTDGRFRYVAHSGRGAKEGLAGFVAAIAARLKTRLRDHGPELEKNQGIKLGGYAQPTVSTAGEYAEKTVGWCFGPDVFWAQAQTRESYGVPAPEWIYAGMLEGFGSSYRFVFYHPSSGRLREIIEIT